MFEDILGEKENGKDEKNEKDSLIESMKYNIEEKDKIIHKLTKEITDLEKTIRTIQSSPTQVK